MYQCLDQWLEEGPDLVFPRRKFLFPVKITVVKNVAVHTALHSKQSDWKSFKHSVLNRTYCLDYVIVVKLSHDCVFFFSLSSRIFKKFSFKC